MKSGDVRVWEGETSSVHKSIDNTVSIISQLIVTLRTDTGGRGILAFVSNDSENINKHRTIKKIMGE